MALSVCVRPFCVVLMRLLCVPACECVCVCDAALWGMTCVACLLCVRVAPAVIGWPWRYVCWGAVLYDRQLVSAGQRKEGRVRESALGGVRGFLKVHRGGRVGL